MRFIPFLLLLACSDADSGEVRTSDPGSPSHIVMAEFDPWMRLTLAPPLSTHMVPGWNKVARITLEVDTETTMRSVAFTQWHTDAAGTDWQSCTSLGTSDKFRLYIVNGIDTGGSEFLTELTPTWSFLDYEGGSCDEDDYLGISIASGIEVAIFEESEQAFVMEYNSTGASTTRPDYMRVDIRYAEGFLWESDGGTYDGTNIEGIPVDNEYVSFGRDG